MPRVPRKSIVIGTTIMAVVLTFLLPAHPGSAGSLDQEAEHEQTVTATNRSSFRLVLRSSGSQHKPGVVRVLSNSVRV
jgi:hypothetical protein